MSQILSNTKAKVRDVEVFKTEVERDAAEIAQAMRRLKKKITAKIRSDANENGILVGEVSSVLKFD